MSISSWRIVSKWVNVSRCVSMSQPQLMLSSVIRHTRSSANIKAVVVYVCVGLPARICRANLGRVAKCHFSFIEQNLQTKFYPKKRVNLDNFGNHWRKLSQRIILEDKCWPDSICWHLYQIRLACAQKSPKCLPNLQISLHGYIRHIRDILQLWQQFTFTKILTQAKKYHHFLLLMSRALVDSMGHQWSTQSNSSNIRNKCNKQTNKAKCKRSSKKTSLVAQRTRVLALRTHKKQCSLETYECS